MSTTSKLIKIIEARIKELEEVMERYKGNMIDTKYIREQLSFNKMLLGLEDKE